MPEKEENMQIEQLQQYEVLEKREIRDIQSICYTVKHKKSGAKLALVSNKDDNKVFYIGFRTPPEDSTGLPHILEHSVLCGSKHFPAKDPFVELAKGSLNTFLNAMTYPDRTVYPVASCNEKDFQNLMHVYMDAVFYPNIYEREEIFRQEGWHYELDNVEGELTYNGVVYNEMKGAFSSPEGVLEREIMNTLFPDNSYGVESGGDPKVIPQLKYSQFLSFHSKYYHPSNSYIYLYGDMDMAEKLQWLDEEYLCKFDAMEISSEIKEQKPFDKMRECFKKYPITEDEKEEDNTFLSFNKVIGSCLDKELSVAFQVLDYALLSAPGAPIRRALIEAGIGKDIMGYFENGVYQPYFTVIAKNANGSQKEQFKQVITQTLQKAVVDGIDQKSIEAALNSMEFRFREADFGNYPKGLMYGLRMFDTWLHDEEHPFDMLEMLDLYEELRKKNKTGYYEDLVQKYLLDNTHGSYVIVEPQKGLIAIEDAKTAKALADYKESLTQQQKEELVCKAAKLKKYQQEPSTKEELEMIPLLSVSDIKKEAPSFYNEEKYVEDTLVLFHNIFTNKIGYIKLVFDTSAVAEEDIPYISLLRSIYGYIDTDKYSYMEMTNEINCNTGGITKSVNVCTTMEDKDTLITSFSFSAKALYEKMEFAFEMVSEMLHHSKLDDTRRLGEIIGEMRSKIQMELQNAGHSAAMSRAASYYSQAAYYSELTDGIAYYHFIKDLDENFEQKKEEIVSKLKKTAQAIFCADNLMVDFTGEEKVFPQLSAAVRKFKDTLSEQMFDKKKYHFRLEQKKEGFKTSSQVQYVACCGDFKKNGLAYTGALRVLKNVMAYDYLWGQVRVQGGAYGCMNNFGRNGNSFFVSYRDPNLEKTLDVYKKAAEFIRSCKFDERDMTKFIIGAVSVLDAPLTPAAKGERSYAAYMQKISEAFIQKERDEVLSADLDTLHSLAPYAEAMMGQDNLCVIGSEEKIESQKHLFSRIETL